MKKVFLMLCLSAIFQVGVSQIKPNETLIFSGSYELGGMMTNLAQVTMRTEPMNTSKKSYLRLSIEVSTFDKWDSFFKIRDLYESYVEPITLKPSLYKRNVLEGGYTKTEKYSFNAAGTSLTSVASRMKRAETKRTLNVPASASDVVSMVYKLRMIDLSKIKNGQSLPFVIIFDEKQLPVWVKLLGKETIPAGNLGKKECYKLSISAKTNKLKGADKNLIWISADSKRIPCLIKFSIPVGVGQVTLLKAAGV